MRLRHFLLVLSLILVGCSGGSDDEKQTLTVFAASSLTNTFEAIEEAFEAEHPDVDVVFHFAGSSQLAAQLRAGAPGDAFASANPRQMEIAEQTSVITGEATVFAYNYLVIIVPRLNPQDIENLDDLGGEGLKWVTASPGVPIRDYTEAVLSDLDPALRAAIEGNIVSEESNVRQIVVKVALGEADAGIVYASDVTPDVADQVTLIAIPPEMNVSATYLIAPVAGTGNEVLAQAFIDFVLASEDAIVAWGLMPVAEATHIG